MVYGGDSCWSDSFPICVFGWPGDARSIHVCNNVDVSPLLLLNRSRLTSSGVQSALARSLSSANVWVAGKSGGRTAQPGV